ncbi:MAG TPA: AAA family ATPase, partial [Polyangiaceae bacterium]|nr:AAA family ATPase [Polyangiaceae bacterium]
VAVHAAIRPYGGHLQLIRADGFDVVFGAPRAQEDHAKRAILAAQALQSGWADTRGSRLEGGGTSLALGLGIHSGRVVVRSGPDGTTPLLVGAVSLLAAQLAQNADGETPLLSGDTAELVRSFVDLRQLTELLVPGRAQALTTFQIVGQSTPRLRLASEARHSGPFVGRRSELEFLREHLRRARGGAGQAVSIVAPPGMGKSRLLAEFQSELEHGPERGGVTTLCGRCQSYGQHIPYLPFVDLLRDWWGIGEREGIHSTRGKAIQGLSNAGMTSSEVVHSVLDLLGAPGESLGAKQPAQLRAQTFGALHRLFLDASEQKPLVLMIEDLHWADATSAQYLSSLAGQLGGHRLLLLTTFRPEYRPPWYGGGAERSKPSASVHVQLALAPLGRAESEQVVGALGQGALSAQLSARIIERSEGNPFFLTALTQAVLTPDSDGVTSGVPNTIQSVLGARIDRLSPLAKQALQVAAVIGADVPRALLEAVTAQASEPFGKALAELEASELLYEAQLSPESRYAFQHSLVEDVAYQSLLRKTRQELHRRILFAQLEMLNRHGALDSSPLSDRGERIAYHAVRGEVWDKAADFCQQAGTRAFAHGSNAEAASYFEQAISALDRLPRNRDTITRAIDLRLSLRSALLPSSDLERILACLREAEVLAESLGDSRRLAQIAFFLSLQLYLGGQHRPAAAAGRRAQLLSEGTENAVVHALATYLIGIPTQALGEYRSAIACFERTLAALEGPKRHEFFQLAILPSVTCCAFHATCAAELGDFPSARVKGLEGVRIADAVAHRPTQMFAAWGAGWVAFRQGDAQTALEFLERALGICRESELMLHFAMVAVPLGSTYLLAGRAEAAVALLEETLAHVVARKLVNYHGVCSYSLAEALLETGKLEEARAHAERAIELTQKQGERGYEAYAWRALGDISARGGEPVRALECYRSSLNVAQELQMRPLQARCWAALEVTERSLGHAAEARACRERADQLFADLG